MKQIQLTFIENQTYAIADLLPGDAPKTCEAIWNLLKTPYETPVTHSIFVGRELNAPIPPNLWSFDGKKLSKENLTVFPERGDILWHYFPPYSEKGVRDKVYNISIIYGPETRLFLPAGWVPHTVFAHITSGMEKFAEMCDRVRKEGTKVIRVCRFSNYSR